MFSSSNETEATNPFAKSFISRIYNQQPVKISIPKKDRDNIFSNFRNRRLLEEILKAHPSIEPLNHAIETAVRTSKNLQSAILSECVYTYDIAALLGLTNLIKCEAGSSQLPSMAIEQMKKRKMAPRYAYFDNKKNEYLIQAGGPNAVDACFVSVAERQILWIEYKEPDAKFGEADLLYDDSGYIVKSPLFLKKHSHFVPMLDEALSADLNIFEYSAKETNFNEFKESTVSDAIVNYFKEPNDTLVFSEDLDSNLVGFLAKDLPRFASKIQGEIRSAGRNSKKVFTASHFNETFARLGGTIGPSGEYSIEKVKIKNFRYPRGGIKGTITGIKLSSLYFVRMTDLIEKDGRYIFNRNSVKQLKSSIASKCFNSQIQFDDVKKYYLS